MNAGFHLRDGLYFTRLENGAVRIDWCSGPDWDNPIKSLTVPENEWASVVCSVSKDGETAERWKRARLFHGTEFSQVHPNLEAPPRVLTAEEEEWMNAPIGIPKANLNATVTVEPIKGEPDTTNFPKLVHRKGYPDWLFLAVATPRAPNGKEVTVYRMTEGFGTVAVYTYTHRLLEDYVEVAPKQRATFTVET